MNKSNLIRAFIFMLTIFSLSGCAKVFTNAGDKPVKSPCEACKKSPFYVNGKRV